MQPLLRLMAGLALATYAATSLAAGVLTGGEKYQIPDWFKESFLELADDAEEAAEADRHALVFIHAPE